MTSKTTAVLSLTVLLALLHYLKELVYWAKSMVWLTGFSQNVHSTPNKFFTLSDKLSDNELWFISGLFLNGYDRSYQMCGPQIRFAILLVVSWVPWLLLWLCKCILVSFSLFRLFLLLLGSKKKMHQPHLSHLAFINTLA